MSAPDRPKGECRRAKHAAMPVRAQRPLNAAALLLGTALLAGCGSLVPANDAPAPPLRGDFRPGPTADRGGPTDPNAPAADTPPAVAAQAAAREWDGFFLDPRLRQVVGIAIAQNRGLRASAAAVERVRAQYRITQAARLPEVALGSSAARQHNTGSAGRVYTVGVSLAQWEIDLFDRLGSLTGAALSRYLAQQETQQSTRLSVVAEVSNAWLTLAAEQQRLVLAQSLRDSQQRTLDLSEQQYRLGAVSGLDRTRARTAFESARGEVARSAVAVTQARLALEQLAGQPLPDTLLPTAQEPTAVTALPAIPGGLPADVLLQRPDLRAAEKQLQASAFDVGAARAARFPRLTLTASAGTRSNELDGLFQSGSGFWSLVPQIDLPIFDGGARRAQVEVSEADRRAALADYEATVQAAFREVADALAVRDGLAERLAAQQAQVEAAELTADLAERTYRIGGSSQLELLTAQRDLAAARQGWVTLRLAEQVNRIDLLRTLGGRWPGGQ